MKRSKWRRMVEDESEKHGGFVRSQSKVLRDKDECEEIENTRQWDGESAKSEVLRDPAQKEEYRSRMQELTNKN